MCTVAAAPPVVAVMIIVHLLPFVCVCVRACARLVFVQSLQAYVLKLLSSALKFALLCRAHTQP